jgi:hypothetical protein
MEDARPIIGSDWTDDALLPRTSQCYIRRRHALKGDRPITYPSRICYCMSDKSTPPHPT